MPRKSDVLGVRVRSFGESVDLGAALFGRFAPRLLPFYAIPLVCFGGLALLCLQAAPWWTLLALWWMKPLWDRLVLLPASVLAFNPGASWRELAASLRGLRRSGLLSDLSWRRFSPLRCLLLPAKLLEGLKGAELRARLRLLASGDARKAFLLTLFSLFLEACLAPSFLPLFVLFLPAELQSRLMGPSLEPYLFAGLYVLDLLLLEPLYALGGFGLYLNRRTVLEGWDLDLAFRSMAARSGEQRKRPSGAALRGAVLAFAAAAALWTAQPAAADYVAPNAATPENAAKAEAWRLGAKNALSSPDFGTETTEKTWTLKAQPEKKKSAPLFDPLPLLRFLQKNLARVLLGLGLLAVLAGCVAFAVAMARRGRGSGRADPASGTAVPAESGPADPLASWPERCLELWRAGERHLALSLLYRAALSFLAAEARSRGIEPDERSLTEAEALRLLRRLGPAGSGPESAAALEAVLRGRIDETYRSLPVDEASFLAQRAALAALGNPIPAVASMGIGASPGGAS